MIILAGLILCRFNLMWKALTRSQHNELTKNSQRHHTKFTVSLRNEVIVT